MKANSGVWEPKVALIVAAPSVAHEGIVKTALVFVNSLIVSCFPQSVKLIAFVFYGNPVPMIVTSYPPFVLPLSFDVDVSAKAASMEGIDLSILAYPMGSITMTG